MIWINLSAASLPRNDGTDDPRDGEGPMTQRLILPRDRTTEFSRTHHKDKERSGSTLCERAWLSDREVLLVPGNTSLPILLPQSRQDQRYGLGGVPTPAGSTS